MGIKAELGAFAFLAPGARLADRRSRLAAIGRGMDTPLYRGQDHLQVSDAHRFIEGKENPDGSFSMSAIVMPMPPPSGGALIASPNSALREEVLHG